MARPPSQLDVPQRNDTSILVQLSESCARHRSRHDKHGISSHPVDDEGDVPKFCQDVINSLRKILPKVEKNYRAPTNPQAEDIGHICDFYEQVIEGGFCPHAPHLLRLGKRANDVLPRIHFLFENLLSVSVLEDTTTNNKTGSTRVFEKICQTAAQLFAMVPEHSVLQDIIHDWVQLALDLSLFSQSNIVEETSDVEIIMFDRVLGQHFVDEKEEYVLILQKKEHLYMIQSALITVLHQSLHFLKEKRQSTSNLLDAMQVEMGNHYGNDDAYFLPLVHERPEILEEVLAMARQVLLSNIPESSKVQALSFRSRIATIHLLQMMDSDSRHVGNLSVLASLRLHSHVLIAQTVRRILRTKQDSTISKLEASYIRKVANCLSGTVQHANESRDQSDLLALLLDNLQSINTSLHHSNGNPARRALEVSVLRSIHFLLIQVRKRAAGEEIIRYRDCIIHLIGLSKDPDFQEYSIWIISTFFQQNMCGSDLEEMCGHALQMMTERGDTDDGVSSGSKRKIPDDNMLSKKRAKSVDIDHRCTSNGRSRECAESLPSLVLEDLLELLVYQTQSDQLFCSTTLIKMLGGVRIILNLAAAGNLLLKPKTEEWLKRALDIAFEFARKFGSIGGSPDNLVAVRRLVCCGLHVSLIRRHHPGLFVQLPIHSYIQTCQHVFSSIQDDNDTGNTEKYPWILDCIFHHGLHDQFSDELRDPCPLASFVAEVFNSTVIRVSFDTSRVFSQQLDKVIWSSDQSNESQATRLNLLMSEFKIVLPSSELSLQPKTCRVLVLLDFQKMKLESRKLSLLSIQWILREMPLQELRRIFCHPDQGQALNSSFAFELIHFILDCCFFKEDASVRIIATEILKLSVIDGGLSVVTCLLSTQEEWSILNSGAGNAKQLSFIRILDQLVTRFFRYVDALLHSRCCLPQSQLSLTVGSIASSNSDKSLKKDGMIEQLIFYCRSVTRVLLSFCTDSEDYFMRRFLQSSLTRVVRLWSGPGSLRNETQWICFVELSRWSCLTTRSQIFEDENMKLFGPNLFREVLVPNSAILTIDGRTGMENIRDGTKERQCLLLTSFIGYFILSRSAQGSFVVTLNHRGVNEIERYLGFLLPYVFSQLIIEKDYDALRLTTSFKLFLLGQKHFESKQKMRISSGVRMDYLHDVSIGSPKSTFITSSLLSRVWTHDLEEQTGFLCSSSELFATLLPLVFTRAGEAELNFFTQTVLRNRLKSLSEAIKANERVILKTLLLEIGENNVNNDHILRALRLVDHFRTVDIEPDSSNPTATVYRSFKEKEQDISAWITTHFMYLVVNVVQFRWRTKSDKEKVQALRSLLFAVRLLEPKESCQYFPQIIATLNAAVALYEARITHDTEDVLVLGTRILSEFIKLTGESNKELLAQNLKVVLVSLVPILSEGEILCESSARRSSRDAAVELLEGLVQGDLGKWLAPFFSDIPFLPSNHALQGVRESLRSLGVDNDTIISTQGTQDGTSADQSNNDTARQEALRQRLAIVCPLVSHENAGVRQIALKHIIDLLKANRYLFHAIVENEGDTSMKHYLTVIKTGTSGSSCGTVTELVESLMSRCLVETDENSRILLATCIGEVGAIAVDRLEERSDRICVVKIEQGPWKSRAAKHQLKLVTEQLVTALKAAHSSSDQHKIMFTIQQILALLDRSSYKSKTPDNPTSGGKREMSDWLSALLSDAGVLDVVEPFWWTEFCESDSVVPSKGPPFFIDASSYFGWMSNWCSYMARRAYESKETEWSELFYSCRTALRTPVGLETAEYLLPILILDRVCFGDAQDEKIILDEVRSALSFGPDASSNMLHTERQKVVNTLLDVIETLQRWHEQETESRRSGDTKTMGSLETTNGHQREPNTMAKERSDSNWPLDESVVRIDDILVSIPLSLRARAAACVGMHSRALRLFEMVSRSDIAKAVFEDTKYGSVKQTRSRAAGSNTGSELEFLIETLCSLDDYETLTCLLDDETAKTAVTFSWGAIKKKEVSGDWEGALQDYERAIQLQRTDDNESVHLQKGALRCLLELGHFESVMNQVSGLMAESPTCGSDCSVFDEYLPASVEASWRLGDWKSLEKLCNSETRSKCSLECAGLTQGDIILDLKKGKPEKAMAHIKRARRLVMDKLSINASEGYARAFRDVISLHALREIEDVAGQVCDAIASRDLGGIIAKTDLSWDRRLNFVGPVGSSHILDTRLALSRLAGDAVLEGSIFLKMGKLARKDGLLGSAANALSQAQAVFSKVGNWKGRGITRSSMHLQFAKLKHDCGECTSALRMLNIGDLDTLINLDDSDLRLQVHERVKNFLGSDCHGMQDEETVSVFAKSVLQSTRWMIEGGLKGGSEIMSRFRILHQVAPRLEKGHFYFAKYVDSILRSRITAILRKSPEERSRESEDILDGFAVAHDKACQRYILLAIKHYVEALVIDIRHVYQALPRLLSLWFEFTSIGKSEHLKNNTLEALGSHAMQVLTQNQEEANAVIATKYKQIVVPAFYTALPQLISRVKHPNNDTTTVVHGILRRVLTKYPAQAMWPLAWLRQSRQHDRQKAGNEIFREAEIRLTGYSNTRLHLLLVESKGLFEWLQKLAKFEPKKLSCAEIKVSLWQGQTDLEEFIPPVQAALSASFSIGDSDRSRDLFPRHVPRIRAFSPIIKIMQSKARPKILKASVVSAESVSKIKDRTTGREGSNGCFDIGEIHFLVKREAKGDLRKDARVQELNNVVNRLLATSTAGRTVNHRRPLRLRTFSVTCLSEDTGILEWVPDTSSFRSLIGKAYNPQVNTFSPHRRGTRLANLGDPMLRRDYEKCQEIFFVSKNLKGAAKMFEELCLKTNPPLLFWWFVQAFENPNAWYEARTRFTRSSAAWAAVGHVLGVGDRHAENILVDTSSGECVHVDFDCIFDKGLHLPKPEVVPFRLTQNMLDAFGPTGADGIFSDTLYQAMHTLRDNRDTLLSVLEPFLKDPVIDWKRSRSQQQSKGSSGDDHNTKEAKRSINVIDERLRGIYNLRNPNYKRIKRNDTFVTQEDEELTHMLPLSVEGQVHKMIAEATSHENLVQMYIGWMAWL